MVRSMLNTFYISNKVTDQRVVHKTNRILRLVFRFDMNSKKLT